MRGRGSAERAAREARPPEAGGTRGGAGRRRLRQALLVAVGGLYAASIPWYRAADATPDSWLGLPDWVAVALVCYVLAAFANAGAWLLSDVRDGDAGPPDEAGR